MGIYNFSNFFTHPVADEEDKVEHEQLELKEGSCNNWQGEERADDNGTTQTLLAGNSRIPGSHWKLAEIS